MLLRKVSMANEMLASVPARLSRGMREQLELVKLRFGQVIYAPRKTIRYVYFPLTSLISLLTSVDRRRSIEVGMVGNEGMAGMPFILGVGDSGVRAIVQGGGEAARMAVGPFRIEFERNRPLRVALFRYAHAQVAQVSQTAACNRFHGAEPRLVRWLLMTRDRVQSNEFALTHKFLAHMLGLRREAVTAAAHALKLRSLIDYQRGVIRLLDAKRLEASSCSCYRTVKDIYDRASRA